MYYINYEFNVNDLFAVYLRKSQADDPTEPIEITLSKHKARLQEVIKYYKINEEQIKYYEEVVSGDTIANRPQMQELLRNVNNGIYKGVFVVALDRLSRGDAIDQGIVNNSFLYSNTLIITPNKIYDIANNDADREQLEFGLFMSKREYNLIKTRMYNGRVDSAKQGFFAGSITPFGYTKIKYKGDKGYTLVPDENAEIVKEIFDMAIKGIGVNSIAKYLNSINIKPKKNNQWTPSMVSKILYRPVYYGVIQWGQQKTIKKMIDGKVVKKIIYTKDYALYQGKHEPLITKEQFDYAHKVMAEKPFSKIPRNLEPKSSLAGLVYCKDCGRTMKRRPTWDKVKLLCSTPNCKCIMSEYELVEKRIIDALNEIYKNYSIILDNYSKEIVIENNSEKEIKIIEKQINKNRNSLNKIMEFYELGDYTRQEFLNRKEEINKEFESLLNKKNDILKNNENNKIEIIKKQIPILKKCLNNYNTIEEPKEKNKLLKSIIKKVIYSKYVSGSGKKELKDKFNLEIELQTNL